MLTVKKEEFDRGISVVLTGTIEENVSFEQLIGPFHGELIVNCKGITRINSVGVKTWMRYFQSLKMRGHQFKFVDCPQPIVEQLNMITNFACGGEVVSIMLPYTCGKCQKEFGASVKTKDLTESGLQIPSIKCERTDCAAEFDDDPEDYLYFLDDQ